MAESLRPASEADGHAREPHAREPHADERHAGFRPVECDRCGAAVLVAKFSQQHTSMQWTAASVRACAEFSARVDTGEQTALIDTCTSLRDSIDRAVRQDRLRVVPP